MIEESIKQKQSQQQPTKPPQRQESNIFDRICDKLMKYLQCTVIFTIPKLKQIHKASQIDQQTIDQQNVSEKSGHNVLKNQSKIQNQANQSHSALEINNEKYIKQIQVVIRDPDNYDQIQKPRLRRKTHKDDIKKYRHKVIQSKSGWEEFKKWFFCESPPIQDYNNRIQTRKMPLKKYIRLQDNQYTLSEYEIKSQKYGMSNIFDIEQNFNEDFQKFDIKPARKLLRQNKKSKMKSTLQSQTTYQQQQVYNFDEEQQHQKDNMAQLEQPVKKQQTKSYKSQSQIISSKVRKPKMKFQIKQQNQEQDFEIQIEPEDLQQQQQQIAQNTNIKDIKMTSKSKAKQKKTKKRNILIKNRDPENGQKDQQQQYNYYLQKDDKQLVSTMQPIGKKSKKKANKKLSIIQTPIPQLQQQTYELQQQVLSPKKTLRPNNNDQVDNKKDTKEQQNGQGIQSIIYNEDDNQVEDANTQNRSNIYNLKIKNKKVLNKTGIYSQKQQQQSYEIDTQLNQMDYNNNDITYQQSEYQEHIQKMAQSFSLEPQKVSTFDPSLTQVFKKGYKKHKKSKIRHNSNITIQNQASFKNKKFVSKQQQQPIDHQFQFSMEQESD